MSKPIDWPTLCTTGALLALRTDPAAVVPCTLAGCTRPKKHQGRHNGQPKQTKPKQTNKRNEWTFG